MTSIVIEKSQEQDIHSSETLQKLTLEQFLNLPETDESYELVDGEAIKKMSPKFFYLWVVYPPMRSITVFFGDRPPETYRGDRLLTDELFPNLAVTSEQFFVKAGI